MCSKCASVSSSALSSCSACGMCALRGVRAWRAVACARWRAGVWACGAVRTHAAHGVRVVRMACVPFLIGAPLSSALSAVLARERPCASDTGEVCTDVFKIFTDKNLHTCNDPQIQTTSTAGENGNGSSSAHVAGDRVRSDIRDDGAR